MFRMVTDTFYAAPQITVSDVADAADAGFSKMNRPTRPPGQKSQQLLRPLAWNMWPFPLHMPALQNGK